ncbi:flavin reductase family protein [Neobacillus sp. BF23-41]|uniref:flavin reductase family protein n=1 Tax=Neobacillus sp. BF23-41 TaxID=3240280 RepID=UPI0034E5E910
MQESFDSRFFRNACGQFLTGVAIVTTTGENGKPVGITANSFTSVSLGPPLILVSLDKKLGSFSAFMNSEGYAVHVLAEEQQELSGHFAKRGVDKFQELDYKEGLYHVPVISNALAVFECRVHQKVDAGDHTLLLGRVERVQINDPARRPLGYLRGRYIVPEQENELTK